VPTIWATIAGIISVGISSLAMASPDLEVQTSGWGAFILRRRRERKSAIFLLFSCPRRKNVTDGPSVGCV
jgi:hypothetical protein